MKEKNEIKENTINKEEKNETEENNNENIISLKENAYNNPELHRYNLSIAPMLEITTKHYMHFMRLLTKQTLIYSEMINQLAALNTVINSMENNLQNIQPAINTENHINISEAHAWDYEHISELANKVADILLPSIQRALGGANNAY